MQKKFLMVIEQTESNQRPKEVNKRNKK